MVLKHPDEDKKKYSQPVFVFDEKKEEKNTDEIPEHENIIEQKGFKSIKDEDVYASLSEQKIEKDLGADNRRTTNLSCRKITN